MRVVWLAILVLVLAGADLRSVAVAVAETVPSPAVSSLPSPAVSSLPGAAQRAAIAIARDRLDTLLRTGHADAAWFSASFLAQIPASKVDAVVADVKAALGEYRSLEFTPAKFIAHFAKGTDDVLIHLDAENHIDGLLFRPPVLAAASLDDGLRALRRFPGTLSYVILKEGRFQRAALAASAPLAVGSAFKLAVLNALADEIASGRRHWSDVVPLERGWKSLPSGVLQTWPDRTPLTLATLAAQMMSISDNTAADALIRIVGANALRPYADANQPFLTTREAFTLRAAANVRLLTAYRDAATPAARRAVLARIDALPLPAIAQLTVTPQLAVEWQYSVRELCRLGNRVANVAAMSIDPGAADAARFRHVAFKGGSDAGVINLTTMVTTKRGTNICFSATLNEATANIDETGFASAYGAVLNALASE